MPRAPMIMTEGTTRLWMTSSPQAARGPARVPSRILHPWQRTAPRLALASTRTCRMQTPRPTSLYLATKPSLLLRTDVATRQAACTSIIWASPISTSNTPTLSELLWLTLAALPPTSSQISKPSMFRVPDQLSPALARIVWLVQFKSRLCYVSILLAHNQAFGQHAKTSALSSLISDTRSLSVPLWSLTVQYANERLSRPRMGNDHVILALTTRQYRNDLKRNVTNLVTPLPLPPFPVLSGPRCSCDCSLLAILPNLSHTASPSSCTDSLFLNLVSGLGQRHL